MSSLRAQDLIGKSVVELRELFKNHTSEEVMEYYSDSKDIQKRHLINIAVEKGFKPTTFELFLKIDYEHIDIFLNSLDCHENLDLIKDGTSMNAIKVLFPKQLAEFIGNYIDSAPKAQVLKELLAINNPICSMYSSIVEIPAQKMINFLSSLDRSESLELITSENYHYIRDKFPEQAKELIVRYVNSTPKTELKELFMNNSSLYDAAENAFGSEGQLDERLAEGFADIKNFAELSDVLEVVEWNGHFNGVIRLVVEKFLASTTNFQDLLDALISYKIVSPYMLNLRSNLEKTILASLDNKMNLDIYTKQFQEFHSKNQDDYSLTSPALIDRLKEVNALSIDSAATFLVDSPAAKEAEELLFSYAKSYNGVFQYLVSIDKSVNLYEGLIINGKFALLKRIENETELEIKIQPRHIFSKLFNLQLDSYNDRITLVKDFWNFVDKAVLREQLTFDGLTPKQIDFKFGIMDILRDFATESDNLNFYERAILNPDDESCVNLNNMDFLFTAPQNSFGVSYFDLALLAGKADVAAKLLDLGFKPNAYPEGFTSLDFLMLNKHLSELYTLEDIQLTVLQSDFIDVDKQDENGQTPADIFIGMPGEMQDLVFAKSKDKMQKFLRGDYYVLDESRTNIAISAGEGYWSSMAFGTGRLLARKNDVDFYIVNMEAVNATDASIFDKFDGWINPGAGDTYPKDPNGFNLDSWSPKSAIELMHFKALEYADKLHIPYLGICAGAQHLALYHDSNVKPVNPNDTSQNIVIQLGSLVHFMALNSEEQKDALTSCATTVPEFKGDRAHSFALDESKIGATINVGAISEEGTPMLYVHENGIRFGKQFHAENYYGKPPSQNNIPQKEILDNFVSIAKMHSAHRVDGGANPEDIMQAIAHRLSECVEHTYFNAFEDTCPKSAEDVGMLEWYVEQYFV